MDALARGDDTAPAATGGAAVLAITKVACGLHHSALLGLHGGVQAFLAVLMNQEKYLSHVLPQSVRHWIAAARAAGMTGVRIDFDGNGITRVRPDHVQLGGALVWDAGGMVVYLPIDANPATASRELRVAVGYTPNVLNDCVADIAFTLLLDVARRAAEADRFVRRGDWLKEKVPLATRVSGKRLGLVGMGHIGRTIARRASGFDMELRYHDRNVIADVPHGHEPGLLALARWADFLVVAAAGGPGSQGLISAEMLDALGPKGFLINIARGSLVDEPALVRALQECRIAGAGLDVFADEPRVPEALLALDHVVLAPHVASGTIETRQAMANLVLENLHAFFNQGRVAVAAPLS